MQVHRRLIFILFIITATIFTIFRASKNFAPDSDSASEPVFDVEPVKTSRRGPDWSAMRDYEARLPQHRDPASTSARYVRFSVQSQRIGWNNFLSELLMNAYLAHASGRGYVFPQYSWDITHTPWKEGEADDWPPHTPLNALASGPVVGGPWEAGDKTPRSITAEWFDTICPNSETVYLNSKAMKKDRSWNEGVDMFKGYVEVLRDEPARCVDIVMSDDDGTPQLFDMYLWGEKRLLSLWDEYRKSPVSRLHGPSYLVQSALVRNQYLFEPRHGGVSPYARLLAIHLRRGDYSDACLHYAKYVSNFNGWNQLDFLPDRFTPPTDEKARDDLYLHRCAPTMSEILEKIRQSHAAWTGTDRIDTIFLMTNEKGPWLKELKEKLYAAGWTNIISSRDLTFITVEEQEVAMAVDMEIARHSGIFIGNGWSSFSSNIVRSRLIDGHAPNSIHFF